MRLTNALDVSSGHSLYERAAEPAIGAVFLFHGLICRVEKTTGTDPRAPVIVEETRPAWIVKGRVRRAERAQLAIWTVAAVASAIETQRAGAFIRVEGAR